MRTALAVLLIAPPLFADYDPFALDKAKIETVDLVVKDDARKREIPIKVYLPKSTSPSPIVLFSHGLGGSKENGEYLGRHWAARGYVAVFLQHPGSDESVWKDAAPLKRLAAMKSAASAANFQLRVKDVPAAIDQLERWHKSDGHPLAGRLDLSKIGMSGHSFGAVTSQAVSGQSFPIIKSLTEPRIKAAVMMSPSVPAAGDPARAFGSVKIPWLLMTGTNDTSIINDTTVEQRLAVYPALPPGGKYEVVLDKGEHSAFSDRALPGEKGKRNPNHHRVVLALTTAFFDAHVKGDAEARAWLDGDGPRTVLEKDDRWQKK